MSVGEVPTDIIEVMARRHTVYPAARRLSAASGLVVRRARLRRGWTQRELGERTGVSTSVLSRMELGQGWNVPLGTWASVAVALDIDLGPGDDRRAAWGVDAVIALATTGGWVRDRRRPDLVLRRDPRLAAGLWRPRMTVGELLLVVVTDVLR
jgi:transcriptional regulator with XRE-family HTH domain